MSCDAVAMASSVIDIDEAVRKLIPVDILRKAIVAFLKSKCSDINLWESSYSKNFSVYFSKNGRPMKIDYDDQSGGFVVLSDGYSAENDAESVRVEIEKFIRSLAAVAIAGKAKTAIGRVGRVTGETTAANGARVISFEI